MYAREYTRVGTGFMEVFPALRLAAAGSESRDYMFYYFCVCGVGGVGGAVGVRVPLLKLRSRDLFLMSHQHLGGACFMQVKLLSLNHFSLDLLLSGIGATPQE